ncbi:MAG: hypothetical protein COB04_10420 [Gammaproteobacteria bacterium]|nr:MAG: hypothetical protein COB04_10420 [Gammaproteobacteria bacterium]
MDSEFTEICLLGHRVKAVQEILKRYNELSVAGLNIKKSLFKHPRFCKTEFYQVTDLVSGRIILELHGDGQQLEVTQYNNNKTSWRYFMDLSAKIKGIGKSLSILIS